MNRQQRRANDRKNSKYNNATYNLTRSQLDSTVRESIDAELKQAYMDGRDHGIEQAMFLLLALPVEVLKDFYWKKSYESRLPEFTEHVLDYYEKWQNSELDTDKLKDDLYRYGGIKVED